MKIQLLFGAGLLLVIVPGLLLGVSYADAGRWAPPSDIRWFLILVGVVLLVAGKWLDQTVKGGDNRKDAEHDP